MDISDYKLEKLYRQFADDETHKISTISPMDNRELRWKHFITCKYENFGVIKMGFHMNGVPADRKDQGFIEFNPNSFANYNPFWLEYDKLLDYFPFGAEIVRFDLAVDIPIIRDNIAFVKDNRMYTCYRKSALDFTETLGQRSTVGRVKLYNKQLESGLEAPLTRLEITGNLDNINIPKVYNLTELPKSEKLLAQVVLRNDNFTLAMSDLPLYRRGKLMEELRQNQIHFNDECISSVVGYSKKLARN